MTEAQDRPAVLTELDGEIWRITLDRPETGNSLTPAMAAELAAAFAARPAQSRVVLLMGNGPRFCVGGDVTSFADATDPGAFVGQLARDWHEVIRLVLYCPVPVVAGVQGAVAGAGVGLVGACDLVVCARTTKIRPAYQAIGFSPDGGASWALAPSLGGPPARDPHPRRAAGRRGAADRRVRSGPRGPGGRPGVRREAGAGLPQRPLRVSAPGGRGKARRRGAGPPPRRRR